MWKSERQADLELRYQDIERALSESRHRFLSQSRCARPSNNRHRHALTLQSDPTFVTGWGAGNIVSDPQRKSAVEDLAAQGFGTLKHDRESTRKIDARGVYGQGSYKSCFAERCTAPAQGAVALQPGSTVPVAFAVWNGSAGDRDGKKSVTIWQDLKIAK